MITGLMRVKNEARWIVRSIQSILPVCDHVIVMDDHSIDGTPDLCQAQPNVTVFTSPFAGLNETRDKNHLLERARGSEWVLMIDGDELLQPGAADRVLIAAKQRADAYTMRVLYLWDNEAQVRTDGIYGHFYRPSMFRPRNHIFESTSAGGNFHCGNVPLALQPYSRVLDCALLHLGYLHREDRLRKYDWYNLKDPNNVREDGYRHIVQGDIKHVPAEAILLHAGPLKLEALYVPARN